MSVEGGSKASGGATSRLDALSARAPLDLLVVGGGIVGAAVARDAAMRGLSVAVVDRRDFAFGTSSRSSRLLHGGLRYLAQGRVGLVREASREKLTLARIAPHLVRPMPFVFPTYTGSGWPRWKLGVGVKLYDMLCGGLGRNLGWSMTLCADEALATVPGLEPHGLTGAVRYFDAFTNDARLVLDTLRSAAAAGAAAISYVSFAAATRSGDVWNCRLQDVESGDECEVTAHVVVNAAGAWADRFPASRVRLRLTKGVHLVVERHRLPVDQAVVMTDGPRILFVIPWGECVILGTTDTDYDGSAESPDCDASDIAYLLDIANRTFPQAGLSPPDIVSAWSGLRPLIADRGARRTSDISRAHRIRVTEPGWIDIAGGKLTTCRLMAEQAVDAVESQLGRRPTSCRTGVEPLLSGAAAGDQYSGVLPPEVSQAAVSHFCRWEWARHLDDVMIRRTGWLYYHREHLPIAERVAAWMGDELNWPPARRAEELSRYQEMTRPAAAVWLPLRLFPGAALLSCRSGSR